MSDLLGRPYTRDTSEGRGVIGRGDEMAKVVEDLNAARQTGEAADGVVIHSATENVVKSITKFIERTGGKVEDGIKLGDKVVRGAEMGAKTAVKESWQAIQGFGEDFVDSMKTTGKVLFEGTKYGAKGIGAAVLVGASLPLSGIAGVAELGQHAAHYLTEARGSVNGWLLHGVEAAAAAVQAKALAGQVSEKNRVELHRTNHQDRLSNIRELHILPKLVKGTLFK